MAIKSNESRILSYIFSIYFIFSLIISTIVLYIGNGNQVAFSQGYITPLSDNSKSKSFICPQIAYSGPTYTGPDGCAAPCPTTTGDNIPKGCPTPSGSTATTTPTSQQQQPNSNCNTRFMIGCASINPSNTTSTSTSTTSRTTSALCASGVLSDAVCNSNIPFGSCPAGVESIAACNFGNSKSQLESNPVCQTASCSIQGGINGERICDPGPCTNTTSQTTPSTTSCPIAPQTTTSALQAAICGLTNTQPGSCPPGVQSIVACNTGKTQGQAR